MHRVLSIIIFQIFLIGSLFGQAEKMGSINLEISTINEDAHLIYVYLFDNKGAFLKYAMDSLSVLPSGGKASISFHGIKPGEYGISAYQDINDNHTMDRNIIGIPKEPTACSNGAVGRFGPPRWRDARFEVSGDAVIMKLSLKKY
jgi:uncharacterized protein (DUF2141 family)